MNDCKDPTKSGRLAKWLNLLQPVPTLIGLIVLVVLEWYTCLGLIGAFVAITLPIAIYQWYFVRCPRCKVRGFHSIYAIQGKGHASVSVQHCRQCNLCLVQHRDGEVEVPFEGFEESAGRIFHGERPLRQT